MLSLFTIYSGVYYFMLIFQVYGLLWVRLLSCVYYVQLYGSLGNYVSGLSRLLLWVRLLPYVYYVLQSL